MQSMYVILPVSKQLCANQLMEIWQKMLILPHFYFKILLNHKKITEQGVLEPCLEGAAPQMLVEICNTGFGVRTKCIF